MLLFQSNDTKENSNSRFLCKEVLKTCNYKKSFFFCACCIKNLVFVTYRKRGSYNITNYLTKKKIDLIAFLIDVCVS